MTKDCRALSPFVRQLPNEATEFFRILNSTESVFMKSGLVTLMAGEECESHNTDDREELIIVLEGRGEIEAEGNGKKGISKGLVAYNPPHVQHNVRNTGDEPMRYIYVVSKAVLN